MSKIYIQKSLSNFDDQKIGYLKNAILFVKNEMQLETDFKIYIVDKKYDVQMTTGAYDPKTHDIFCLGEGRSLIDVIRSILHELQHCKQNEENRITDVAENGATGSPIEDEAHAVAGKMVRLVGKKWPEIYKI